MSKKLTESQKEVRSRFGRLSAYVAALRKKCFRERDKQHPLSEKEKSFIKRIVSLVDEYDLPANRRGDESEGDDKEWEALLETEGVDAE